jgi:hypothetical protein
MLSTRAPVGAQRHESDITLVAKHRRRNHLAIGTLSGLDCGKDSFTVEIRSLLSEQMHDAESIFHQHALTLSPVLTSKRCY